jgi:hypothetical protein
MTINPAIKACSRDDLIALLEGCCIQCYDHESDTVLREALQCSLKDGDLRLGDIEARIGQR